MTLITGLKLAIGALLLMMAGLMVCMVPTGKEARHRHSGDIATHRGFGNMLAGVTGMLVIAVLGLEFAVRGNRPLAAFTLLFAVHIAAAVAYLTALLLMRFRLTGLTHPKLHKRIAYALLMPSFVVMAVSGIVLLVRL